MKNKDFRRLLDGIEELTPNQRKRLSDRLAEGDAREAAAALIERTREEIKACPHCGSEKLQRWGKATRLQRYRCKACGKTFNALTGTPLARLRLKEKWLDYAEELAKGHTLKQSAEAVGVHLNTAFRWRHRFLALPKEQKAEQLSGIAEADETFFLESFKGKKRDMPRGPRKRGGTARKAGVSKEQIPVLVARDRSGATADEVLKEVTGDEIIRVLGPLLAPDVILCADGHGAYRSLAKEMGIPLKVLSRRQGIRVINKVFHIQNVNAYDRRLKEWMRRFNGVATRHLPSYLGWRRLLERSSGGASSKDVLQAALGRW